MGDVLKELEELGWAFEDEDDPAVYRDSKPVAVEPGFATSSPHDASSSSATDDKGTVKEVVPASEASGHEVTAASATDGAPGISKSTEETIPTPTNEPAPVKRDADVANIGAEPNDELAEDVEDRLIPFEDRDVDASGQLIKPTQRIFYKKTRRGSIARIVREHYLRPLEAQDMNGLPFTVALDNALNVAAEGRRKGGPVHFLVPDPGVGQHFLDMFEFERSIERMIWLDTVLKEIHEVATRRTYIRLRTMIGDARRSFAVFNNEYFAETFILRDPKEDVARRNDRAICRATNWIRHYLAVRWDVVQRKTPIEATAKPEAASTSKQQPQPKRQKGKKAQTGKSPVQTLPKETSELESKQGPPELIILTYSASLKRRAEKLGLRALTCEEYVSEFYPAGENRSLVELCESLSQLYQQKLQQQAEQKRAGITRTVRTSVYEEYRQDEVLEAELKSGAIFKGVMHVSGQNHSEARVRPSEASGMTSDIFIPTRDARNRAVHGDLVAVELLPESQWSAPSMIVKREDEEDDATTPGIEDITSIFMLTHIAGSSEATKERMPTGKVVGVYQRNWRPYVMTVQLESIKQGSDTVICVPMDHRIPKARIRTRQASLLQNQRIVVALDEWDVDSFFPNGHYIRQLGEIGEIETETAAILVENSINAPPFSAAILQSLPSLTGENAWMVTEEEAARRRDIRKSHRVYSIDPLGCQDIDDALSIRFLTKGHVEVGVHIADVSHFIAHGSLLDLEARARSTTNYLADRRLDMIPAVLSEQLCSLRENVDRLAVSVFWIFNEKNEIIEGKTWYGRTAIHSVHELYYERAQAIIDSQLPAEERKKLPDYDLLHKELVKFLELSEAIKAQRKRKGALELASTETRFELNERKAPIKLKTKEDLPVHSLVAEFMILANNYVARRTYQSYPTSALLRHHPFPRLASFGPLIECAGAKGFSIDVSSSKRLAESLDAAVIPSDPNFNHILRQLATQAMAEAQYFSTGSCEVDEFYHYGLALDMYTHFTSPIRRYADVIVHRQLLNSLKEPKGPELMNDELMRALATHINRKHRAAKNAQKDSADLFKSLYFRSKAPEDEDAMIIDMRENALLVFIAKYGIKGTVYLRDRQGQSRIPPDALVGIKGKGSLQVSNYTFDRLKQRVLLHTAKGDVVVGLFDHVTAQIYVDESRAHKLSLRLELVRFGIDSQGKEAPARVNLTKEVLKQRTPKIDLPRCLIPTKMEAIDADLAEFKQSPPGETGYDLWNKRAERQSIILERPAVAVSMDTVGETVTNDRTSEEGAVQVRKKSEGTTKGRRKRGKGKATETAEGSAQEGRSQARGEAKGPDLAVRRWRKNDLKKDRPWYRTLHERDEELNEHEESSLNSAATTLSSLPGASFDNDGRGSQWD